MPVLIIPKAGGVKECHVLDQGPYYLGRGETCEIPLHDSSVSRRHAKIEREGRGWRIEDLGSKNGTMVNGAMITRATVSYGDEILIGDIRVHFQESLFHKTAQDEHQAEESAPVRPDEGSGESPWDVLHELVEAASTAKDESDLLKCGLGIIHTRLDCDHIYLGLWDKRKRALGSGVYRTQGDEALFPIPEGALEKVIASKQGLCLYDVRKEFKLLKKPQGAKACSAACVPMLVRGELEGLIYAERGPSKPAHRKEDVVFLTALAAILGAFLRVASDMGALRKINKELKRRVEGLELVGGSREMTEVREKIAAFGSRSDSPIFIQGESGTGKELVARLIHRFSSRSEKPFLNVNCAALPEHLIETELFGRVRGPEPGAERDRRGLFELANGGTLYLDDIGGMNPGMQARLLRAIETGEFQPVGSDRKVKTDVRIIAAANRDPADMIKEGLLRPDLFLQLEGLQLTMPPLREHRDDITLLAEHFLDLGRMRLSTPVKDFSAAAIDKMKYYEWPGNVRQLANVIDRALYLCDGETIMPEHLPGLEYSDGESEAEDFEDFEGDVPYESALQTEGIRIDSGPLKKALEDLEKAQIQNALQKHKWNMSHVAGELGVTRNELAEKMKKYGL